MESDTKVVHLGVGKESTGAISVPIYQTAAFRHPGFGQSTGYDYSRSANPTRQILEEGIADLDGGQRGFAYSSGMAAITNLLLLFKAGDRLIVTEDLYGGTFRILDRVFGQYGLKAEYVDTSDLNAVEHGLKSGTVKGVLIETPTNPLLKVADINEIARLARKYGAISIFDNTFMTPYLQQPLKMGADIVVYSATKYIAGHNDVVAGLVTVRDRELAEKIYFLQNSTGAVLGPMDSWLVIRGMKTLGIRLERQQRNAQSIARWLQKHKAVTKVFYPGLESHPGHGLQRKQAGGFGGMLAFELINPGAAKEVLNRVKIVSFAESLGGVETLITYPAFQTHADIPEEQRSKLGINDRLLRLSVGIEDEGDLIADLQQALEEEEGY